MPPAAGHGCYPNHALSRTGDWMAEIYSTWTAAHGIIM
jgi:multimeric flavodoxin WrbA